jgi:hypothetical protein
VAQFYGGVLSREAFEGRVASESNSAALGGFLYALVDHPDPKQRDPEFALRALQDNAVIIVQARWPATVEIVARIRLEDWAGALEIFEGRFKPQFLMLLTPMSYDFVRSLIYSHLGRDVEALQAYKRGMLAWEEATLDYPTVWDHSDAQRWRSEAEAVLAK